MSKAENVLPTGTAVGGVCRPDPRLWTLPEVELSGARVVGQSLTLECHDALRSRDEQRFFDWCIDIMEDAGVVGILTNDYVYQASSLHGEIRPGTGSPYFLVLTRTSVEFDIQGSKGAPIQFDPVVFETDGDVLEAHELRAAFDMIRRQSSLLRAWKDSTSMASNRSVVLKNFRMPVGDSDIAMEVETSLGEFTIVIRRTPIRGTFNYALSDAESPFIYSTRVVDALLSDAAEDAGGVPDPATVILAMIGTAWLARRDPEWLAAVAARNGRRA